MKESKKYSVLSIKIGSLLVVVFVLFFCSCIKVTKTTDQYYIEQEPSFFSLRNSSWLTNEWIRKPENLKMVQQTFEKFGYRNLLVNVNINDSRFLVNDIYIKKDFYVLMDSLELSYYDTSSCSEYYKEFWARRDAEKNSDIVFDILNGFNSSNNSITQRRLAQQQCVNPAPPDYSLANDTLYALLDVEFNNAKSTAPEFIKKFSLLEKYGMHQSAYNLLFQQHTSMSIVIPEGLPYDSLKSTLSVSETPQDAWLIDNTK